jgi:hypothetical protein
VQRLARTVARLGAPLAVLSFWGGMAAAARLYPSGYDWGYQTISVLMYPDHNPRGYLWAWAALELCGIAGIVWTIHLGHRFEGHSAWRLRAVRILRVGLLCMCCAVVPDRALPFSKGHELLAILAFIGISIGIIQQIFVLVSNRHATREPNSSTHTISSARARLETVLWAAVPLLPLLLAGLTQAYLALARPALPWVSPAWRALGVPLYLSFGLWEWISCVMFSLCLIVLWYLLEHSQAID